jgi:hypothetical protein
MVKGLASNHMKLLTRRERIIPRILQVRPKAGQESPPKNWLG